MRITICNHKIYEWNRLVLWPGLYNGINSKFYGCIMSSNDIVHYYGRLNGSALL